MAIVQKGNPVLSAIAQPVQDFRSRELKHLITAMAEAMFIEPDGIGIAAPQIGVSQQIFLIARDVLDARALEGRIENAKKNAPAVKQDITEKDYFVFINPFFEKISKKKTSDIEGCLSVRGWYGTVIRPHKVTIRYANASGALHVRGASGLFARALQHEMDHLNGILFIDKARDKQKISNQ